MRMLINATQPDELRVAITLGSKLINLDTEIPGQEQKRSNIYKGVIVSIEKSLGAVFVKYTTESDVRHGFLPLKEVSREYFLQQPENLEDIDIHRVLREGQELVVQVEKEERGTKGAALTTFISLAGSYLVLMPNNPRAGGISRRIEGDERDTLKESISKLNLPEGMGVIIRTAGVDRSPEELQWDLDVLLRYWEAIKKAAVIKSGPYLIHQESEVVIRAIRDYLRQDIEEIIVDEPNAYERAKGYLSQVRPDFLPKLKLYTDHLPLYSRFQIEQQIEQAYQREVTLPSGGSIVIDSTEALVSIDINSARATHGSNIEETAHQTNLEAAEEIARQLRIRDIGGLIVIDFIDMLASKNQRDVENRLRDALRHDRARIQIGKISRFGLLEMSRQRLRSSLSRTTQITCPRCAGRGSVRGVESMALSIIHLIQEHASQAGDVALHVQVPLDIATYILNEKRDVLRSIESHTQIGIVIIPNQHLVSPQYLIKEVKDEQGKTTPSYKLVKAPKAEPANRRQQAQSKKSNEPAINEFLTSATNTAPPSRKSSGGVIRRLWEIMFGPDEPSRKAYYKKDKRSPQERQAQPKRQPQSSRQRPHSAKRNNPARRPDTNKEGQKQTARRGNRGGTRRTHPGQAQPMDDSHHASARRTHPEQVAAQPIDDSHRTSTRRTNPEQGQPQPKQDIHESKAHEKSSTNFEQTKSSSRSHRPSAPSSKPNVPSASSEDTKNHQTTSEKPTSTPKKQEEPAQKPSTETKGPVIKVENSPLSRPGQRLEQVTTKTDEK